MSQSPVKNPDVVMREDEKEALLFNPADGAMLCVNETAAFIWKKCDGSHSQDDIIKGIIDEYEVSQDTAAKDFCTYLEKLDKVGFIGYKT